MLLTLGFSRNRALGAVGCLLLLASTLAIQPPAAAQTVEPTLYASNAFPDRLQSIRIYGSGWTPDATVILIPCPDVTDEADASGDTCDTRNVVAITIPQDGNLLVEVEWFVPAEGLIFGAADTQETQGAVTTIVTAIEGQLEASVVGPGAQDVRVHGSQWPPRLAIFVLPCPGIATEADATGDTCNTAELTPVVTGTDGTFTATARWDIPPEGLIFIAGDPAFTAFGISTVLVEPVRWRTDAKSTLHLDTPGKAIVSSQYRDDAGIGQPERLERLAIAAANSSTSSSGLSIRFRIRCYGPDGDVLVRRGGTATIAPGERFKRRAMVPAGQVSCAVSLRTIKSDSFAGTGVLKIRSLRSST